MTSDQSALPTGSFEARYLAFLETVAQLRPALHRYCARMTGSVMDGEDVVQEALFEAYRKLDHYDESRPLKPWLFRIAHNRCVDLLRHRGVRDEAEAIAAVPDFMLPSEPAAMGIGRAVEHLVLVLPPKERACLLLKDVFDYSLEEIAELVDSTVGGVKAALSRGRAKLTNSETSTRHSRPVSLAARHVMELYIERFNRRDWDGVRDLISSEARLTVANAFAGSMATAPYFSNWNRFPTPWKLSLGQVDDELVVIILQATAGTWKAYSLVRLDIANAKIQSVVDYVHCPWILSSASNVRLAEVMP